MTQIICVNCHTKKTDIYDIIMDNFNLQRFLSAQEQKYSQALSEIQNGEKVGHWIWYIFPQMRGLGHSYRSTFYGIESLAEAKSYIDHPVLGARLREITNALMLHAGNKTAREILGYIDAVKVKSCMTLFFKASGDLLFKDALDAYYDGEMSSATLSLINATPD